MSYNSNTVLLSTKLKIPVPRKNYIVRHTLFNQLDQCNDVSIIYICSGAGTGKTTLLSTYIQERELKKVVWLTLDASNSSIYSFWLYFLSAISTLCKDSEEILSSLNFAREEAQIEEILVRVINQLNSHEDYYMVLDDAQYLCDETLRHTIEFFINSMPSNLHLFLLSREESNLYLGALAVSGRLLVIDGNQMLLTPEEGETFLKYTMKVTINEDEIDQLLQYAEGWIGGLQLAAAAGLTGRASGRLLRRDYGITSEYLSREMFQKLTKEEQEFLILTCFPSYFNLELCLSLVEGMDENKFQSTMEHLVQKNLFIICIDEQKGIYRYHNILSEFLMQIFLKIPKNEQQELHTKAGRLFENQGDMVESLREFTVAEEYYEIMRLAKTMGGRIESWPYLDQIPIHILIEDADLSAQCLMFNLGNMNIEKSRVIFDAFRTTYGETNMAGVMRFLEFYVTYEDGSLPQYQYISEEQIQLLPLGPVAKAMLLIENAIAMMGCMKYEEAEANIRKAIQISNGTNALVEYFAYSQLAQIYEESGRLNESLYCYEKASNISIPPQVSQAMITNYYVGIAGVYMRRMELETADYILVKALDIIAEQKIVNLVTDITIKFHLVEMKLLKGDTSAVVNFIDEISHEFPKFSILSISRLIYELDCMNCLSDEHAQQFILELEQEENFKTQLFMRLIKARLQRRNGNIEEACKEIDDILFLSRLNKNHLRLVEAGLAKIYMLQQSNMKSEQNREIHNLLREVLHYAYKDQILMPFYLERLTVLPMLQNMIKRSDEMKALSEAEQVFLRKCIAVCESRSIVINQELLSSRELEILKELSLGITNREIADKLCISQATVKTHVLSIFGKLGVGSRMMAVEAGRREGLLPYTD